MTRLIYVSHPEVVIDPRVPVPDWGLSETGRDRAVALAGRGWPGGHWRIVSSPERKACETAAILAAGSPVVVDDRTGEVDRSATGYVPHAEHAALAEALFASPEVSAAGWERAVDAQARVVAALTDLIADGRDLMMIGHGGVGSFLWCHVAGREIAPVEDAPGMGCVWQARLGPAGWEPLHGWRRFEEI